MDNLIKLEMKSMYTFISVVSRIILIVKKSPPTMKRDKNADYCVCTKINFLRVGDSLVIYLALPAVSLIFKAGIVSIINNATMLNN
jgi:hypothetical protein